MITGVIRYQGGTLVVELPCGAYELAEHLGSIGIRSPASEILAHGTEQVEVKLAAGEPIGAIILANLQDSDTLSGVNLACQEVNRVCPFGYAGSRLASRFQPLCVLQALRNPAAQHRRGHEIHFGGKQALPFHDGELPHCMRSGGRGGRLQYQGSKPHDGVR